MVSTPIRFNNVIGDLKLHIISLNVVRTAGNYMHQPLNIEVFTFFHRKNWYFWIIKYTRLHISLKKQKNIYNIVHLPYNWER
jgi:hypothetical protein